MASEDFKGERSASLGDDASGNSRLMQADEWDEVQPLTPLRTKLHVPLRRPKWISRPRLDKRMHEGFARKLTLISAPAGFGKTTLLVDWVHTHKIPAAWFSVDKGDNGPLHFLTYVILGLQTLKDDIGKAALTMLRSPQPPLIESILINLINDVIRSPSDMALVLDDYHLIDARPIHDMIAFLLENLPQQMHIIIATRSDPPLPLLARLRSQNQLTELRAADLNFRTDETASLFNESLNLHLSAEDIQMLKARTEGWIAGLQLAALSLQGHKDPTRFINAFKGDNRYIADYLLEEVLNRQPEHLRNFLLQTSILGRMSGSLCDAVTDQENSQQVLNTLEKTNLFVISLDDERCWYRYHQLFADLLEQRLRVNQSDPVPELHARASHWLALNGFKNDAVDHAFAAQDYARAAQLIEEIAEIDWDRARESRLLEWFKKLPNEHIEANPKLCIIYARELFKSGYLDDAEKRLQAAEQILDSISNADLNKKGLRGRIAVIRAYMSTRKGDFPGTITFSRQALKLLPQKDLNWRSVAATILGFGYLDDMIESQKAFSEAMKLSKTAGNIYYHIFAGSCLGSNMFKRGKLKEAKDISQQLLSLAIENSIEETGIAGSLYLNLGSVFCEWSDLDEGIRLINRGIELSKLGRDPVILASCQLGLLRALMYRMDLAGAVKLMQDINEQAGNFTLPPWITSTISALNVFFWIGSGKLDTALQWAQDRGLHVDDKLGSLNELEHLAFAHILMTQNKLDEADLLLERLIENATAGDRVYMIIEMRLYRVLALMLKADLAAALAELKSALALGEPGGFIMIFVSKGRPVAGLLEKIVAVKKRDHDVTKAGFSLSYAKKILSVYKAGTPPKIEGLMDPMSERELDVLHLIAAGLSNREIAEKLFISLNTVKTHTKNINSKLNVNSRTKAVARAKELGLL